MKEAKQTISTTELNQKTSEFIARVAYGKEIFVIVKHGRPAAELRPISSEKRKQQDQGSTSN